MDPRTSRGYLNNNPGNIDRSAAVWVGEIRDINSCKNDIQRRELTSGRFCVFTSSEYGIRAMAKNLRAYKKAFACQSIRDYINRWAPPSENNTEAYIQTVAAKTGHGPDDPVDLELALPHLIEAIIGVECGGMPYEDGEIERGIDLAGR